MTPSVSHKRLILVAQDDEDVYAMTRDAVRSCGIGADTVRVCDGAELLVYLLRKAPFTKAARPDLVLLDLGMPVHGGLWALEKIRSHGPLRALPVVIWSRSAPPADVRKAYQLGANAFVERPLGPDALEKAIQETLRFFFVTALRATPQVRQ